MLNPKLRLIREHNRLYKCWMRLLWRLYGMQSPMVLMVHGFKPTQAECKSAFEMTAASFERLMQYLIDEGWHAMTYDELVQMIETRQWQPKHFYLSFDDIYDTVYTEAYRVLQRLNIPFTLFVTKALVDQPSFITTPHLQILTQNPLCTLGCHGLEHTRFRILSADEMTRQCKEEKLWFENTFDKAVDIFAFPYGRIVEVSNANRRQIRKMGFSMAFSAIEGTLRAVWFTGKYFLPRVNVSETFVARFTQGKRLRYKDCEGR